MQYSDFNWNILSTEHFKIYHYDHEKELAEHGAYFLEESYKYLQQKFKYSLIDTVPVVFYASPIHFKQTNTTPGLIPDGVGGFFEFIKGRVVIPYEGSLGQFKHVIRHELIHVFMTSKISTQLKNHGQISDRQPPLWFTEGLAEFWSTKWDAQADMVLKDAVINKYIVGLNDWEEFYGTFFMYKLGQKVLEYISENYGEDKVFQLIENFWMDENFSNVMKITLGKDYEEFDKEFLKYLKDIYLVQKEKRDIPSKTTKGIGFDGFAHKPAFTNFNGKDEIYFIGNRTGFTSIYKKSLSGNKKIERIIKGEASDEYEQFHFFRTGIDISGLGHLAFVTQKGEADAIHFYDLKNDEVINDYSFKDIIGIGSPSWNKDGTKVVFSAIEFSGKSDLYIFDLKTKSLTRLTNDFYDDRDPDFSPDGNFIVFSSDRTMYGVNNKYNLFLYDIRTNQIYYLTKGDYSDFSPSFSEDGKKIIYTSDVGGTQNIWLLNLPTTFEINPNDSNFYSTIKKNGITNFIASAFDPRWYGNEKIVFSLFEKGGINIRILENIKLENDSLINNLNKNGFSFNDFMTDSLWFPQKVLGIYNKNISRYEKFFSLDIATTSISTDPVFGTNAGGILSLSDMLGNERYYFLIYNNANGETEFWKSFNIAISKLSLEKRLNYAYGVYHLSGRRYDLRDSDFPYFERIYGGYVGFSYPLSFFRRIETFASLSQSVKDVDITDNTRSLLLSNSISYVKDNSIWNWTGPVDGERYNLTLGYTVDIDNSNLSYYSILFDFRKYFRISKPLTLALRTQLFVNEGKNPRRFFTGGSWSLRGWDRFSIRGSKMWETNLELRFPLVNLMKVRFPLGLRFPGINAAVFFDAGNAWDTKENYEETKGSIGVGLRLNFLGAIVFRYDIGKRIENNFTKLQNDLFYQFFFGWDF